MNSSPISKTVIEIPKSVKNSLGNKKWQLILSLREFGSTSNASPAKVKIAKSQGKQRGKKRNDASERTRIISNGNVKGHGASSNSNTGKKGKKAKKAAKVAKPKPAKAVTTHVQGEYGPFMSKNFARKRAAMMRKTRNDTDAAANVAEERREAARMKEIAQLSEEHSQQVLLRASLQHHKTKKERDPGYF